MTSQGEMYDGIVNKIDVPLPDATSFLPPTPKCTILPFVVNPFPCNVISVPTVPALGERYCIESGPLLEPEFVTTTVAVATFEPLGPVTVNVIVYVPTDA